MPRPVIEPITDADLLEYCGFLTENLSRERTPEAWAQAFKQDWGVEKPNNGYMLKDGGRIVGGIGAIYSERPVRGKPERFCNITSWCVLDKYRSQSMRLAIALTAQEGFHFTDLTPTEVVSKTLQFLKFKPMNERQAVWLNIPWPGIWFTKTRVISESDEIEAALSLEDRQAFEAHRHLPWLKHLAVGRPGGFCHVVYKVTSLKGMPCAYLLAVSDAERFLKYRLALGNYLLTRHSLLFSRVESRLLPRIPRFVLELSGYRNKVYRSDTMNEADISNLFSEIAALDL